jgi:hypothetical protein
MKAITPQASASPVRRKTPFFLPLLALLVQSAVAATLYVAPTGSDTNPGTQSAPFQGIAKAQSVAVSGDTVYLRGGTYNISSSQIARTDSLYAYVHDISKSGIKYLAYPGETPIFNFSAVKPSGLRVTAFFVSASNCTFRGFHVVGVQVTILTHTGSECFRVEGSNNTFDQLQTHDGMASGIELTKSSSGNLVINCDSYNNWDSVSENGAGGNSDGFGCHTAGSGNVFQYCRAWDNSDDGFDCISCAGAATFDHCWSYHNGFQSSGDGNGFKVGGWGSTVQNRIANPLPVHTVKYCLSANNKAHGFYANHQPGQSANWTNNTSYNHAAGDFDMLERTSPNYSSTSAQTSADDIPGYREVMHYNLGYRGTVVKDLNESGTIVSNNSWTTSVTASDADFESVDATQMTMDLQADGSLPAISFMRLVSGSDLAGLGCFQAGATSTLTVSPSTLSFGSGSGSQSATISSNVSWTASANQSWITVSPASGSNNGSISVSVAQNAGASRSGTVTVSGGGLSRTISVTQGAASSGGSNTYQAESATLGGGSFVETTNTGYNGTGYVNCPTTGGTITFSGVDGGAGGGYVLSIRYANGSGASRSGVLAVNGTSSGITFPATSSWTTWTTLSVSITLNAGTGNTIVLQSNGQDLANIDEITLTPAVTPPTPDTYQAESATLGGGAFIETTNAGYNGSGYVNFPTSGGTCTFSSVDGNGGGAKTISVRYANGGTTTRTGTITVNGVSSSISFAPTGAWTTWGTVSVNVTLANSATNTIQLSSTGTDLGNVDEITVP